MTEEISPPHGEPQASPKPVRDEPKVSRTAKRAARRSAKFAARTDETVAVSPTVRKVLLGAVAANALVQFAIQAWLAYGFAEEVWHLANPLPFATPVALDLFVVNLMVVAFVLRSARRRTRLYIWAVLAAGIGAQVGASEGYALHENWGMWGRVASVFPALFLAGSLHTMIVAWQHTEISPVEASSASEKPAASAKTELTAKAAPAPVSRPKRGALPKPQVTAPRARSSHADAADRLIAEQATAKDIARELNVTPRAVQLWAKARRAELAANPQVNGHVFVPTEQGVN
jgi:hypothetical protein